MSLETKIEDGDFYVYKITYPNGKIYIGMDISKNANLNRWTYFGSLSEAGKRRLCIDLADYDTITVTKEILFTSPIKEDVKMKESELIAACGATDSRIGYNLKK
jgi:hypothetical protein